MMLVLLTACAALCAHGVDPILTPTVSVDPKNPTPYWPKVEEEDRLIPLTDDAPQQVEVSVKIIEFQTNKRRETGLSAYFLKRPVERPEGQVSSSDTSITSADLTFPSGVASGITVFLDMLRMGEGDLEFVLQALVNENRAFILSNPKAMVLIGSQVPTQIKTVERIPYEETVVVGSTTAQTTKFRDTGVSLTITVPQVIDDDKDWSTTEDTYVSLNVDIEVNEEGQRIVVALDDQLAGANFSLARNQIEVPEQITRSIKTSVWVRHGQVLILGGLYRNTASESLSTLPWLGQVENALMGGINRIIPGRTLAKPITSTIGNRAKSEGHRELVFFIKAEAWQPAFTLVDEYDLLSDDDMESMEDEGGE